MSSILAGVAMTGIFQPVVLAVIERNGTYLFTKRIDENPAYHDKWQLPGGGMEFGESPEETLVREVREELGVEIENINLIPYIDYKVRSHWHGIFLSYQCLLKDEDAKIILNEEASAYRWFRPDEIDYAKYPIFEGCVEIIRECPSSFR